MKFSKLFSDMHTEVTDLLETKKRKLEADLNKLQQIRSRALEMQNIFGDFYDKLLKTDAPAENSNIDLPLMHQGTRPTGKESEFISLYKTGVLTAINRFKELIDILENILADPKKPEYRKTYKENREVLDNYLNSEWDEWLTKGSPRDLEKNLSELRRSIELKQ